MSPKKRNHRSDPLSSRGAVAPGQDERQLRLRIIGGKFRGRRLAFTGDERTRPMKDRVREAVFNLLGPRVIGKFAIDLFAGSGALGLEAISRGAVAGLFLERHFPTADCIRQNAATLGIGEICRVAPADTFVWTTRELPHDGTPWVVFCSPPFEFYVSRRDEMLHLIEELTSLAPPQSLFAVEADERFDFGQLPFPEQWDVRAYPPAFVGIWSNQGVAESARDTI